MLACGTKAHLSKALLSAILPDATTPTFASSAESRVFLQDTTKMILQADGSDELEMITDMRTFNGRNPDTSKFQVFWDAVGRVLEEEKERPGLLMVTFTGES